MSANQTFDDSFHRHGHRAIVEFLLSVKSPVIEEEKIVAATAAALEVIDAELANAVFDGILRLIARFVNPGRSSG